MIPVFVEGLRRIIAVACLFAGMALIVQPGPTLVVARVVDFAQSYVRSPYTTTRAGSLADFVRRRTEGRTLDATGTPWAAFARDLRAGTAAGVLQRLSSERLGEAVVFPHDALPAFPEGDIGSLLYIHVPADDLWISLSREHAPEIEGLDRRWAYPHRTAGLALLPLAFLVLFLPSPVRPPPGALTYSRAPSVVLPDLLGLVGGAFFFTLPLLILAEQAPGQSPVQAAGGWSWLTWSFWLMAAGFLLLNGVAFYYATLHLLITDAALVVRKGARSHAYAWADMAACSPYASPRGRIIGVLLILFGRGPAMVGQGLLVASNTERGLEIRMRDGRSLRIMANSFPGFPAVVDALHRRGVPGTPSVEA